MCRYFKVRDKVNNTATQTDTIILDTTPPDLLSVIINNGETETKSSSVTININAQDDLSGIYQISFSNDMKEWTPWENYSSIKNYIFPSGDGQKTIYVKITDHANNIAGPVEATIVIKSHKSENQNIFNSEVISFITIAIIIILVVIALLFMRKKKNRDDKLRSIGTVTIKPGEYPQRSILQDQNNITSNAVQIPNLSSSQRTTITKSFTQGQLFQAPEPSQISEVQQQPQLLPLNLSQNINNQNNQASAGIIYKKTNLQK